MTNVDGYKNIELLREYSLPEAMGGMALVGSVVGALLDMAQSEDLRAENERLRGELAAQQQAQMQALLLQNQQLMALLQQQQAPAAQAGANLGALLEALLAQATPQQQQQVQRLLANNPQAAQRLQLPARAGVKR
jgi:hypothetical protein